MSKTKKQEKKTKRNIQKGEKTFADVMGVGGIVRNEWFDFIVGLIVFSVAGMAFYAIISYMLTGEDDQSLVQELRPGEIFSRSHEFKNGIGSVGAIVSYLLVSRCFGISSLLIPVFGAMCGLQLMRAYKVNLVKWFFSTMLVMIWLSIAFAKFLTRYTILVETMVRCAASILRV